MNKTTIVAVAALALARPAVGQVVYVPDDYPTITAAVIAANNDASMWTIWVRSGNWVGNAGITQPVFLSSTDGPAATSISGSVSITGNTAGVTVTGFTIIDGSITSNPGDVLMQECIFQNSIAVAHAGITVADCSFTGTTDGARVLSANGATIVNCQFFNTTTGATIIRDDTYLTRCLFENNSDSNASEPNGGAMLIDTNATPIIENCTFINNSADFGGAIYNRGNPTFINCLIADNTALFGGAMFNTAIFNTPLMVNCTVARNTAAVGGGILNDDLTILTIWNSIIWNNDPDQVVDDELAVTYFGYSDVMPFPGVPPGPGNVSLTPEFVDPKNGDYRLQAQSNVIDTGHNWAIAGITDTDLDANPRFADGPLSDTGCGLPVLVDMGAYEYQGDPFPVQLGDLDGDGLVGINDFLDLLAAWGPCIQDCCLPDLDLDEDVGITDFLLLLGNWTA